MKPRLTEKNSKQYFITSGLTKILAQTEVEDPGSHLKLQYFATRGMDFHRQATRKIPRDLRPDSEHAQIDESIRLSGNLEKASCRKGCSACCHVRVQVTNSEARQLAKMIHSGEISVDMDRLREQAAFKGNDYEYAVQPREKCRCVFLGEDGTCRIYEKRPTNCRKYLVQSPPELCGVIGGSAQILADLDTEIMASGFADLDKNFDHMPESILREMRDL